MISKEKYKNGNYKVKDPDNIKHNYDFFKKDVIDSKALKKFERKKIGIKEVTKNDYIHHMATYCYFHQKTIEQLINGYKKNQKELTEFEDEDDLDVVYDITEYANHAVKNKQAKVTIQSKVKRVSVFLKRNGVHVPRINVDLKNYDDSEGYFTRKDLPDKEIMKIAISEAKPLYKAIYSFMYVSGSGRAETVSLTKQSVIDGFSEFAESNDPKEIIMELDGKVNEKEVIPLIRMTRRKTGKPYYTVITPECCQFLIDYIKTDLSMLDNLEESFFGIARSTLSGHFYEVNTKHGWGKRGRNNLFSPHRLRHNHLTQIDNLNLSNALEGRVINDAIDKSYNHNLDDPEYLREQYKDHMHKFAIFDHYNVTIRDEEVKKLQEENRMLREQLEETKVSVQNVWDAIEEKRTNIPSHKVHKEILHYLKDIDEMDTDRASLLNLMVFDYVKKNPAQFKDDEEYLRGLIRKLDIQIEMSSKDIVDQHIELAQNMNYDAIDPKFIILLDNLLDKVKSNEGVMKRVGQIDTNKWDYVAEEYLIKKGIVKDISNIGDLQLSEDERNNLANDILMEYLEQ